MYLNNSESIHLPAVFDKIELRHNVSFAMTIDN